MSNHRDNLDAPDREKPKEPGQDQRTPVGPHAKPELTNNDATPGAGSLPEPNDGGDSAGTG